MAIARLPLILVAFWQITQGEVIQQRDEINVADILDLFETSKTRDKRAVCQDKLKGNYCKEYEPYCDNGIYKGYLKKHCSATCNLCSPECADKISYCESYKDRCNDPSVAKSMKHHCAKTCGACKVPPTTLPPTTIPRTEQPIDQGSIECGKKALGTRMVGGTNAKPGAWPWQVTMDYKEHDAPHWCGGSIVAPNWVVTAAHCFAYGTDPNDYTIVAGEHDLNGIEGREQNVPIERIIIHSKYDAYNNNDYDVALMKLKTPIKYTKHVRPVCLAKDEFEAGTYCFVTGWGHTAEGGNIPQILQQAKVPLISRDTCQQGYGDLSYTITSRMRCAGYAKGGIDACQGDSGGPLVCVRKDKWFLVGVVSWGVGCARKGRYGVYADMMEVKYWVQQTINSN